jgi:hypothetical protein
MNRKGQASRRSRQKPAFDANASSFCPSETTDKRQLDAELRNFVKFKYKEEPQQPVFRRRDYLPTLDCITMSPYFRFALKFAGNFSLLQVEPNVVLDWGKVSKVTRMTYDQYQCPICLESAMTAPRITKCGHCFCYPCILRYFMLDDQRHKRCPVCFDTIKKSWLRPVVIQVVKALQDRQIARFVLLRRRKGAVAVERCGVNTTGYSYQGFFESRSNQAIYNRITLHLDEKRDMTDTLTEIDSLTAKTDWEDTELKSIQSAKETLQARLDLLENATKLASASEGEGRDGPGLNEERLEPERSSVTLTSYFAPVCSCTSVFHPLTLELISATPCPRHTTDQDRAAQSLTFNLNDLPEIEEPARSSERFIYFYTLADGQPVFMHSLNIAMLKREYEQYANFPAILEGPVLELTRIVMTEGEQKRQK